MKKLVGIMLIAQWAAAIDTTKIIDSNDMAFFGIRYLDHLEYAFPESQLPPITERNPRPHYNPESYIDDIKNKRTAPVYIKYLNEKCGYGVFAAQDIPARHIIAEYTGIVRRRDFSKVKSDYDYAWGFPPPTKFLIDGKDAANFTRFINHNDDHNVEMIYIPIEGHWHLAYVAKKPIKKDQQLLANYGAPYWKGRGCKPDKLKE
jgi:SET domain